MVIIKFTTGPDWFKANWVYRRLRSDVANVSNDSQLNELLERGEAFGMLSLKELDRGLADRLLRTLTATVEYVLADTSELASCDVTAIEMRGQYRDCLVELRGRIGDQTVATVGN